ncbi:hypothetical protein NM688_g6385 [Phlebia brevispora]|uniref:Uncharacterized protein n=1 Tax=Phlebia brevispora TaxID=194682 RepID=A0ACC1SGV7_9APHY|nr:hypothetical protein NM688_g6385 [Phlebia brevispora]
MNTVHDEHSPNVTSLLKEIVVELKAMREQLPSKQQSKPETVAEDDKVDAELKEQEEAWELAVDTLKKREKDITDSWKDELNNLLVFTGLFSAIVTAFTVVSFTWLQQDPGDATNILLANISLQLSHFIFDAEPHFCLLRDCRPAMASAAPASPRNPSAQGGPTALAQVRWAAGVASPWDHFAVAAPTTDRSGTFSRRPFSIVQGVERYCDHRLRHCGFVRFSRVPGYDLGTIDLTPLPLQITSYSDRHHHPSMGYISFNTSPFVHLIYSAVLLGIGDYKMLVEATSFNKHILPSVHLLSAP